MNKSTTLLSLLVFAILLASCSKSSDTANSSTDPIYLKGLLKKVEFNVTDTMTGNSRSVTYVTYGYDSSKRLSRLDYSTFFTSGFYAKKSVLWLVYNGPAALYPTVINKHDSSQVSANAAFQLLTDYEYRPKYDGLSRKISDSLRKADYPFGSYAVTSTPYKYFSWTQYKYFAGPGTASRRVIYDVTDNFLAIDNYGEYAGIPDPDNNLIIDSLSSEDSPLYFGTLSNALTHTFSYEDYLFALPWGFSTYGYEPYSFSKKIPKGVTTVYKSSINFQRYTMHYYFTYEKTNNQVTKINIVSKAFKQDGSFAGTAKGFVGLTYY